VLRPPALALLALVLPPTLCAGGWARLELEARAIGGRLGSAFAALSPAAAESGAPGADGMDVPDVVSSADGAFELGREPFAGQPKGKSARGHASRAVKSGHGVLIGASTVLRLANRGVVPEGRPVDAAGGRPAGIELSSVSALGVGVQDGDVLTEVAGRSVRSEGQVVGAVLALRARRASSISAVFYRGAERWSLVVEMPYPPGS
jgi:hypothetical protein